MHQSSVEQAQGRVDELRKQLRAEVTAEVQSSMKRRAWRGRLIRCGGCCGLYAIAFVVVLAIALVFVARTGIVRIPIVSDRVTHASEPTRIVIPARSGDLDQLLAAKAQEAFRGRARSAEVRIAFTESEITAVIRSALAGQGGVWADVGAQAQVVVLPDALEIFSRAPGVGGMMTVRMTVTPTIVNGRLALDARETRVGAMRIPRIIMNRIAASLAGRVPPLAIAGGRGVPTLTVTAIDLADGRATLLIK